MEENEIILNLYEKYVIQEMTPTEKYSELKVEFYKNFEILSKNIETENGKILEKICDILFEMENEYGKHCFKKGYTLGADLIKKTKN